MTFETAGDIQDGVTLTTDVCIVGSGAAGLTLAERLGRTRRVLVLEAGGFDSDAEDDSFSIDQLGLPQNSEVASRGRGYGGSTDLWFGRIATLDPIDFERRSWVPHSGWPFPYDELTPWLETAASILRVPNFDRINIEAWMPNATTEMVMRDGKADLGVFLWANGMMMGKVRRRWIERSANVRLLLDATATELIPNDSSAMIESLTVVGPHLQQFSVRAANYVLAAGGIENPRLMLASTRRSQGGVGNAFDMVGRYYMDHPRGEGLAGVDLRGLSRVQLTQLSLLGEKARSPYGRTQLRITFPESLQRNEELLNHSLHAHLVSGVQLEPGYQSLRRLFSGTKPTETASGPGWKAELLECVKVIPRLSALAARQAVRRERPTALVVIDQMEQEPDPSSRITVDFHRTDRFGLPTVRLDWRVADSTFSSQRRMHQLFGAILERAAIRTFWSDALTTPAPSIPLLDMKHPSGTTRMSTSPDTGVVDAHCRVHGLANLYVAGSSVFPTVGHANPTLTIVALAARLAHHLGGPPADDTTGPSIGL
jgi:choline dehydrogenase-like flavoprotein